MLVCTQPKPKVEQYQRLAASIAIKFIPPGVAVEFTEEYAEALRLLWHASKKYKPELGYKFTTYASSVIFKGLSRFQPHVGNTIDPEVFSNVIDDREPPVDFETIIQNSLNSIKHLASVRDIKIFRDDALGLATRAELALEHNLSRVRIGQIIEEVLSILQSKYSNSEEMDLT